MLTDSDVAKKVTFGNTKMSYVVTYGLASFFGLAPT